MLSIQSSSINPFYEVCTRKHDHIPCPDSAGARKGAKGSRKGGARAVLGYHNFEQPPYIFDIINLIHFFIYSSLTISLLPSTSYHCSDDEDEDAWGSPGE